MGPTLARMAKRASEATGVRQRIDAVPLFPAAGKTALEAQGIEPIRCVLVQEDEVAKWPEPPNVIFMAGMNFGTSQNESATWAMNSYLPGVICRKFRHSRI